MPEKMKTTWSTSFRKRYGAGGGKKSADTSNSVANRTRRLDPQVRSLLRDEVVASLGNMVQSPPAQEQPQQNELDEIDRELEHAKEQLEKFQSAEQFVGLRIYKYRRALDQQAQDLKQTKARLCETSTITEPLVVAINTNDDEENLSHVMPPSPDDQGAIDEQMEELERKMIKWEEDDEALARVVDRHREILANVETMRRTIHDLEHKRQEILYMTQECQDFLAASAEPLEESNSPSMTSETEANAVTFATTVPNGDLERGTQGIVEDENSAEECTSAVEDTMQ